jgi:hypothetical protein
MPLVKATFLLISLTLCAAAADLRIGIIGTDTSHVPAFTKLLNDTGPEHLAGAHVVAAFKGGSKDVPESFNRVDKFAEEIRTKYGVEIVDGIPALVSKVDAVLIESVDGRVHLEQARPVIAAHKPLFIDKPLASTLEEAREIARLAKAAGVPWFSSSSLRYGPIGTMGRQPNASAVTTWGPGPFEEHHKLELSWYAIHPIELLYSLMGPGCEAVSRVSGKDLDTIVGRWKDGRIGTVNAARPYADYGAIIFEGRKTIENHPKSAGGEYRPLVEQVLKFFQTGKPPVPNEETLEIFAFMDAAQRSKEQGGKLVTLK